MVDLENLLSTFYNATLDSELRNYARKYIYL